MQATSDEVLIGRIASGDRLAMQVLFARHHVRVYRFVLRLVRDESVAEDLISEVFLDVWRQAGRFEGRSAVSTWLLAIARFKALTALRRKPDEELDEETAAAIEDQSDDPEVVAGEEGQECSDPEVPCGTFGGTSGNHRSRLLPREVGRRGRRDRRNPGEHREDAHVLRAQEIGRAAEGGGNRKRLAMNALNKEAPERQEIEALLPWHAAGTLSRRDRERVERAIASDRELARRFELVREEHHETIHLNESLGVALGARRWRSCLPRSRPKARLRRRAGFDLAGRVASFLSGFAPRTLAYAAAAATIALFLQSAVLTAVLMKDNQDTTTPQLASANTPSNCARRDPLLAAGNVGRDYQLPQCARRRSRRRPGSQRLVQHPLPPRRPRARSSGTCSACSRKPRSLNSLPPKTERWGSRPSAK